MKFTYNHPRPVLRNTVPEDHVQDLEVPEISEQNANIEKLPKSGCSSSKQSMNTLDNHHEKPPRSAIQFTSRVTIFENVRFSAIKPQ